MVKGWKYEVLPRAFINLYYGLHCVMMFAQTIEEKFYADEEVCMEIV